MITTQNQKRLVGFFKEFVNRTLLKHFKSSEDTMAEWNYFSSMISQDFINYEKVRKYIEVMANDNNHSYSPSKTQFKALKPQSEEKKTNSGIYNKKEQVSNDYQRPDFMLNKTVGGNADRIKFTGMFAKPLYSFQSKQKKKFTKQSNGGVANLIQGMVNLCNNMTSNQNKMQSSKSSTPNINMNFNNSNVGGYSWKP